MPGDVGLQHGERVGYPPMMPSNAALQYLCPPLKPSFLRYAVQLPPCPPPLHITAYALRPSTSHALDALEGEGPQRRPPKPLDRRLEEVAKGVGGGCCRLQMPWTLDGNAAQPQPPSPQPHAILRPHISSPTTLSPHNATTPQSHSPMPPPSSSLTAQHQGSFHNSAPLGVRGWGGGPPTPPPPLDPPLKGALPRTPNGEGHVVQRSCT